MIFCATKSGRKLILQRNVPYPLLTGFMDAQEAIFSHQGLLAAFYHINTKSISQHGKEKVRSSLYIQQSEEGKPPKTKVSVTLLSCWLPSIFADVVDHQVSEALHFARRETPFGAFRTDNETTKAKREEHPKQLISRLFIDRVTKRLQKPQKGDTRQQFY